MSDVADDMMIEHPDEKKRFVIQKIKITTDDMECFKLRFIKSFIYFGIPIRVISINFFKINLFGGKKQQLYSL